MDHLVERLLGQPHPLGKGGVIALGMPDDSTLPTTLLWFADAPDTSRWEALGTVDAAVAHVAQKLDVAVSAFLASSDAANLLELRQAVRRMRSVYAFLEPWQASKQNERTEKTLKGIQSATNRLRAIDIFSDTVDDLVETGELGNNSLLPMACAKERQLELESVLTLYKKKTKDLLKKVRKTYPTFKWRKSVCAAGLSEGDFQRRFDEELEALDKDLFGLDLTDAHVVSCARRDAKEVHYVASRLGVVLGPERAQMSSSMDEIQSELGSLSIASDNQKLAHEFSKSPRFRGVRADLGVVARDQAEVVSATLSGLRHREARASKGKAGKKDKGSKN
jgi:CHAD domain-containing protein